MHQSIISIHITNMSSTTQQSKYQHGCIICAINLFSKFGNSHGMFFYQFTCSHLDKTVKTCTYKFNIKSLYFNIFQVIIALLGVYMALNDALEAFHQHDSTMFLFHLVFVFHYSLCYICLFASQIIQYDPVYYENFIELIANSKRDFNIEYIFTKKSEKAVKQMFDTLTITIMITLLCPVLDFVLTTYKNRAFDGKHCFKCVLVLLIIAKETVSRL